MANEIVNVLPIYLFVQNIDIVALSFLYFRYRLHQTLILFDPLAITTDKRYIID